MARELGATALEHSYTALALTEAGDLEHWLGECAGLQSDRKGRFWAIKGHVFLQIDSSGGSPALLLLHFGNLCDLQRPFWTPFGVNY